MLLERTPNVCLKHNVELQEVCDDELCPKCWAELELFGDNYQPSRKLVPELEQVYMPDKHRVVMRKKR